MTMQKQPDGLTRAKAEEIPDPAGGTKQNSTDPKMLTIKFDVSYDSPAFGKVVIGQTERIMDPGKHSGWWKPVPAPPDHVGFLEPFKRHNDAMAHLLKVYDAAMEKGWKPDGANGKPVPSAAVATEAPPPPPATTGGEDTALSPVPDFTIPADTGPAPELPEMPGVPVSAAPPGTDPPIVDLQSPEPPAAPLPEHRLDGVVAEESESVQAVPEGTPEYDHAMAQQRRPGPPVIPQADPEVQKLVVASDDWLTQPAKPADTDYDPFASQAFPLGPEES